MSLNERLPMVDVSRFSMVPRSDVPRSTFKTEHSHKTTFNVDALVPILVDEVLPGDSHFGDLTFFARLATPIFPIMDNLFIETFFFFVPNRIIWDNWVKFCGEQNNPADTTDYVIPQVVSPVGGFAVGSLFDHMGIPGVGQIGAGTINVNTLPMRAYNLIFKEWFRDENLQNSPTIATDDGPDTYTWYNIRNRGKKHDYFTSCLPWPQKGTEVTVPLGTVAPVVASSSLGPTFKEAGAGGFTAQGLFTSAAGANSPIWAGPGVAAGGRGLLWDDTALEADLTAATAASINTFRLAAATQQLLEKDARGGTRYTELLRSHFGVMPEDARLQRPEYIGGGRSYMKTAAIAQTSESATTPLGTLGAAATGSDTHKFRYNAKEHGYIIGLANVAGEITYQQGVKRMWTRQTRYDFYWPTFANLGEQPVYTKELYIDGTATDDVVFGYQERWAEYRHRQSEVTGLFRSTSAGNIDEWHLAEEFASAPSLNSNFIVYSTPMARVLAAGALADQVEVLWDSVFHIKSTRCMPTYSVPGLVRL